MGHQHKLADFQGCQLTYRKEALSSFQLRGQPLEPLNTDPVLFRFLDPAVIRAKNNKDTAPNRDLALLDLPQGLVLMMESRYQ